MSLQLPETIWSQEDLQSVIVEIQTYQRWFAAASIKQQVAGKVAAISEPPVLSPSAVGLLKELSSDTAVSQAGLDTMIKDLQALAAKNEQITITLAAPPPGGLKRSLVKWCRDNIAPEVCVSFRFNATILGGMVVQYGSHIFDWSFRRQILANRAHFPEVLRHV